METLSYEQFSLELQGKTAADRIPLSGAIEVTRRCPLACVHCYNNLPMGNRKARRAELSYDEHCRILDEITNAGCLWLLYTGGEILARKDFLEIYRYAKKKGLLITLFTNGTLITPEVADCLAEHRPLAVEITLFGRTRETYEKLTGTPGSHENCMRGIRLLAERRLPLRLKTVAVTVNRHEIWEMKRFAEEELGVGFRFDGMINPRIDGSPAPLDVRLTPEQIVQLDLMDPARVAGWHKFCRRFNDPIHPKDDADALYHCGGGINTFAIDPEGMLSICVLSRLDTYDLRKGNFDDGWGHFLLRTRRRKITRLTECVACEIKPLCGMCPANGEVECGSAESPVDFLCRVAHLRARSLGIQVQPHGECKYCEGGIAYQEI
jgi:radical SAM protein with 4Fe4S-binding SPASM domain